jgi:hypothetical protein
VHHHFHEYLISFSFANSCLRLYAFSLFSMIIDEVSLFSTLMFSMMSLLCFIVVFYDFISNIMDACGVGLSSRFGSSRKVVSGCFMSIFYVYGRYVTYFLQFFCLLQVTHTDCFGVICWQSSFWFLYTAYIAILFTFVYSNPPWAQTSTFR